MSNPVYKSAVNKIAKIISTKGLKARVSKALKFVSTRIKSLVDGYPIMSSFKKGPLKRADRIVEKLQRSGWTLTNISKLRWTYTKLLNEIGDYARGTVVMGEGINVCFAVSDILREVVYDGGAILVKCKSFLRIGDGYIGTNIIVEYDGIPIEIQCHTKESYAAKNSRVMISDIHRWTLWRLAQDYDALMGENANDDTSKFIRRKSDDVQTTRYVNQHHAYRLSQIITHMLKQKSVIKNKTMSTAIENIRRALVERMVENEVAASGELTRYCIQASLLKVGSFGKKCKDTLKIDAHKLNEQSREIHDMYGEQARRFISRYSDTDDY